MKVTNLEIKYKNKLVLKDINFYVNEGDVLGVIGENGVGKSTLIKMLTGLVSYSSGSYENNFKIGYVPQYIALYENLTVYENMKIFSSMSNLSSKELENNIDIVLNKLNLIKNKNIKIKKLSGGNKRRVNIAVCLVNKPECLIMDEPEVGIDYKVRKDIENMIKEMSKLGMAVIVSSHSKGFIKNISNKVLILEKNTQSFFGDAEDELFEKL